MGRGRNRAAIDPQETDRTIDHRRDRKHGRRSHSRIRADAGADRSAEAETKQGIAPQLWPFPDRGAETVYRPKIPDETGSGIYRARRFVAGRAGDPGARPLVSELFH